MRSNNIQTITLSKKVINDFALERNMLLSKSKKDWVFFVDSDEIVSKELVSEISHLDLQNSNYDGFVINRKNYFLGQYVGLDRIVRLGKKRAGKWVRSVHELWDIKGKVGQLKNPLIHNTATNLHDYITKIDYYSDLHAKANAKEGKTATLIKIVFYPQLKFVESFVKSKSVVFSIMQALHSFLSWSKQYLSFYS